MILGTSDKSVLNAVKREVLALGIQPRVQLERQFVAVKELAGFCNGSDIVVSPYREITTSGALMTGVVRRKAIAVSAIPTFEQIFSHESNPLLVPYGDVDALSTSLLRLIRIPSLRERLTQRLQEGDATLPRWLEIAKRVNAWYRTLACAEARPIRLEERNELRDGRIEPGRY